MQYWYTRIFIGKCTGIVIEHTNKCPRPNIMARKWNVEEKLYSILIEERKKMKQVKFPSNYGVPPDVFVCGDVAT